MAYSPLLQPHNLRIAFLTALALAASGCDTGRADQLDGEQTKVADQAFSAEQRRIAATLSIGNDPTLNGSDDPYDRAIACDIGISALERQLTSNGLLNQEQISALGRIDRNFNSQIAALGRERSKSSEQIAEDRARKLEALPDTSSRMRVAMGCIRDFG
ncbi:MAG: hypothetical protein K5799_07525 [Erythrobacter sp.]|nr:hypothetical protein [Erythrobacter sp.]